MTTQQQRTMEKTAAVGSPPPTIALSSLFFWGFLAIMCGPLGSSQRRCLKLSQYYVLLADLFQKTGGQGAKSVYTNLN